MTPILARAAGHALRLGISAAILAAELAPVTQALSHTFSSRFGGHARGQAAWEHSCPSGCSGVGAWGAGLTVLEHIRAIFIVWMALGAELTPISHRMAGPSQLRSATARYARAKTRSIQHFTVRMQRDLKKREYFCCPGHFGARALNLAPAPAKSKIAV
jgi:hypothetical protein